MPRRYSIHGLAAPGRPRYGVYAALRRRAADEGVSVPELLPTEAARLAARPSITTWLESTRRRSSTVDAGAVVDTLGKLRRDHADR